MGDTDVMMEETTRSIGRDWPVYVLALALGSCASLSESLDRDLRRENSEVLRHTLKELRDQHVVKQALDYSCGAAALATLMVYYFGDPTSEQEILRLLQAGLTSEELAVKAQRGFSLLDLKKVAQVKGYQAGGFKLTVESSSCNWLRLLWSSWNPWAIGILQS